MEEKQSRELTNMLECKDYYPLCPVITEKRNHAHALFRRINDLPELDIENRSALFRQLLGSCSTFFIEPPFRCDYGFNIHLGPNFYANWDCVFLDVASITVGANVFCAPGVHIYTVNHPLDARKRNTIIERGSPVVIGDDVWIGGRAVIVPGVTIGSRCVVAAGAVVTRSFGDDVLIGGNPAKVLKQIANCTDQELEEFKQGHF